MMILAKALSLLLFNLLAMSASSASDAFGQQERFRRRHLQDGGPIEPPKVHEATYGFIALIGRTPSEQRSSLIGSKLFDLTEIAGASRGGYKLYNEIDDMSTSENCFSGVDASEIWWATSTSSLTSQAERSSRGLAGEVALGIEVPLGNSGATGSAETTVQFAAVFGNSETSITVFMQKSSGFTRSFDAYAQRSLYGVEFDYDSITTWTDDFIEACQSLGEDPSQSQLLQLFAEYGTHGLGTAIFGQRCMSSLYLQGGSSLNSYYEFQSDSSSYESGFLWWKSSREQTESSEEMTSSEYGFQFLISDKRCEGELKDDSSCQELKGLGRNSPAIIAWTYKPIWEMPVPGLSQRARNEMANLFQDILVASTRCADNYCNGNGACAPNDLVWDSVDGIIALDEFFDGSKCFCFDDIEGDTCNQRPDSFIKSVDWGRYENDFDEVSEANPDSAGFCGFSSIHNNHREDRIFRFKYCEPQAATKVQGALNTIFRATPFDAHWIAECAGNEVVTYIRSEHSNDKEDRRFEIDCETFNGWETDMCEWTDWVNNFDGRFDFECDKHVFRSGEPRHVIAGIESQHNNKHEDRRFKFKCCRWRGTETILPGVALTPQSVTPVDVPEIIPNTVAPRQAHVSEPAEALTTNRGEGSGSSSQELNEVPVTDVGNSGSDSSRMEVNKIRLLMVVSLSLFVVM